MADNTSTPDQGCRLTFHGVECLAQLEPLWLSLFDWHEEIGAAGLPVIERSASWPLRRALYADFFAHPDTFVVLATLAGAGAGAGAGSGSSTASSSDGATGLGVVTGTFTTSSDGATAKVAGLANQSNVFFGGDSGLKNTITQDTTNPAASGQQASASATAGASVSTTANAQTNYSNYTTGYANVLGTGSFSVN